MSGRHGNRRAGRGGRGRGSGRESSVSKPSCIKKTVEDCHFYVGSSKQASDCETTAEFVVNHVKKTFDRGKDVSEALRTLVRPDTDAWKMTLKMSVDADTNVKQRVDKQCEMECKAELDQAMKRSLKTTHLKRMRHHGNVATRPCKTRLHQDPTMSHQFSTILLHCCKQLKRNIL
jgi:hypothetical protein